MDLIRPSGKVPQNLDCASNIDVFSSRKWLSCRRFSERSRSEFNDGVAPTDIESFQGSQFISMLLYEVCKLGKEPSPLRSRAFEAP